MARAEQPGLTLPEVPPSTGQARVDRERRQRAERVARRRRLEQRAVEIFRRGTHAAGVDVIVAGVDYDRSYLYAQGRGARPPQLAPFLAAVDDPEIGPVLLRELAAPHGLALVSREEGESGVARGLLEILATLMDAIEVAGVLGAVQAVRAGRRVG